MLCSVTLPSKGSLHTETSQPISIANKMIASAQHNPSLKSISEQTIMISVA